MPERLTAVALAGGRLESDFRSAGYTVPSKAYIELGGMTMLERVLRALRAAPSVGRIRVVTDRGAFQNIVGPRGEALCDDIVAGGADPIDSLTRGVGGAHDDEMILVVATDIPLVTGTALEAFVRRLREAPCDIGYGFIGRMPHDRAYPQVRHTWVRLREGVFCGGGVSALRAGAVTQLGNVLRRVAAARKSPLRLAALFSPLFVARLLLGTLGLPDLERRASQITGVTVRGIRCDEPELAVNVDTLADLRTVEQLI